MNTDVRLQTTVWGPDAMAEPLRVAIQREAAILAGHTGREPGSVLAVLDIGHRQWGGGGRCGPSIPQLERLLRESQMDHAVLVTDTPRFVAGGSAPLEDAEGTALLRWWNTAARRNAADGPHMNAVRVGYCPELGHDLPPNAVAQLAHAQLIPGLISLADVAVAIATLSEPGASYTIGEILQVDGGAEAMVTPRAPAAQLVAEGRPPSIRLPHGVRGERGLPGQHFIVTGASSGIGRESALSLAEYGAHVTCIGRRPELLSDVVSEIRHRTGFADALVADLADPVAAANVLPRIGRPVDGMVYAAGMFTFDGRERPELSRHDCMAINFEGYARICDALLAEWIATGRSGTVVAIGSISSVWAPIPWNHSYDASKGAMLQYTRALARTGGRYGVRANAILPGAIETPMVKTAPQNESFKASVTDLSPIGRIGQPLEVAAIASFLAGPQSAHTSGTAVLVDGGGGLGCLRDLRGQA